MEKIKKVWKWLVQSWELETVVSTITHNIGLWIRSIFRAFREPVYTIRATRDRVKYHWQERLSGRNPSSPLVRPVVSSLIMLITYGKVIWYVGRIAIEVILTGFFTLIFWIVDGGPGRLFTQAVHLVQWMWGFELFRTGIAVVSVTLIIFAVNSLRSHRKYVDGLVKEVRDLRESVRRQSRETTDLEQRYGNVISGMEALRLRSLGLRDRVRSKAAEGLRQELEEILKIHPFDKFSSFLDVARDNWTLKLEEVEHARTTKEMMSK